MLTLAELQKRSEVRDKLMNDPANLRGNKKYPLWSLACAQYLHKDIGLTGPAVGWVMSSIFKIDFPKGTIDNILHSEVYYERTKNIREFK